MSVMEVVWCANGVIWGLVLLGWFMENRKLWEDKYRMAKHHRAVHQRRLERLSRSEFTANLGMQEGVRESR